jgi:putative Holliday junction resolvase
MRIMALDVGEKTIGVAVSDVLLLTAQSRPTLRRKDLKSDIDTIRRLAAENDVHEIIIGQPLHMDGRESLQSRKVAQFAERLHDALKLPIVFWDERLTSFEAEEHLRQMGLNWRQRRGQVDKIAAMIILQEYLDRGRDRTA